jgi:hypothetical protein
MPRSPAPKRRHPMNGSPNDGSGLSAVCRGVGPGRRDACAGSAVAPNQGSLAIIPTCPRNIRTMPAGIAGNTDRPHPRGFTGTPQPVIGRAHIPDGDDGDLTHDAKLLIAAATCFLPSGARPGFRRRRLRAITG